MTLINIRDSNKRKDECPYEKQILLINKQGRVLYHKRRTNEMQEKHTFPREIFLKHKAVSVRSDLMDTRVMVCSPSVLPLFSDNFDFQTKDGFVKGILMNDEILDCTIYNHTINVGYATAVTSWRRYQKIRFGTNITKYISFDNNICILAVKYCSNTCIQLDPDYLSKYCLLLYRSVYKIDNTF